MKKLALLLVIVALGVAPGFADDIPDGADCAASEGPVSVTTVLDADDPTTAEADRGAMCVPGVLYIGGEAQAEEDGDPASGACGAIIVGDMTVAGDPDWDNAGADGIPGTEDDEHCN